jgi:hypothetical protein
VDVSATIGHVKEGAVSLVPDEIGIVLLLAWATHEQEDAPVGDVG